jgi:hypothetical protein
MQTPLEVKGRSPQAQFTLKVYRGEGMALLAMNWKKGRRPKKNFVGFSIEYKEPGRQQFLALKNRLTFEGADLTDPNAYSTLRSPIQKFRWIHFPYDTSSSGKFTYRVIPVFMDAAGGISYGVPQMVDIDLQNETYPKEINVAFTRGFVSSQAFVDRYIKFGPISKLLPASAKDGLNFTPTHPKAAEALDWMGFEARKVILSTLDAAIADSSAQVYLVAYDLNLPEIVSRLQKLGGRLKIIIDNSGTHGDPTSAETQAAAQLIQSSGAVNVKRQHMGQLQHNKFIVVDSPTTKMVVCGSTNFSWRAFYVQANNAMLLQGNQSVQIFKQAFEAYWASDDPLVFGTTSSATWNPLGLPAIDGKVAFSPHSPSNALLAADAQDIQTAQSSLLYSLAFLYETPGVIQDAIKTLTVKDQVFIFGISDRQVGGLDIQTPNGNVAPVYPTTLTKNLPEPFLSEPTGNDKYGVRMHHKFVVIDFNLPTARVYLGSYNFSVTADTLNGENHLLIKDKAVAIAYMIEAVRLFDHYQFRLLVQNATANQGKLFLKRPPSVPTDKPWWDGYYTDPRKIHDRKLFA